jgi:ABC-2 type transport system ATP-binding protein
MSVMNGETVDDGSGRIVVRNLTKRFGPVEAVRDLSFIVEPGRVTGFLGPNGAGKTTTLRTALGLVAPTDGEVTINGARHDQLAHPARVVGALLDTGGFHNARTARAHLRIYTAAIGVPDRRADEVLALVGLTEAANRKVGAFSLGMRQRLALATTLLGDPQVLILDEPGSGLDPEGLAWLRGFLRSFAASGRTVLVSSHQLGEIAQTADQVVIISQGTAVFEGRLDQLGGGADRVRVRCADPARLATALAERGVTDIQSTSDDGGASTHGGGLTVTGASPVTVGDVALAAGVAIYGMAEERTDLEQRFLALTTGQYQARAPFESPQVPLGPPVTSGGAAGYSGPPAHPTLPAASGYTGSVGSSGTTGSPGPTGTAGYPGATAYPAPPAAPSQERPR